MTSDEKHESRLPEAAGVGGDQSRHAEGGESHGDDCQAALRDLATQLDGLVQMANWQVILLKDARTKVEEVLDSGPQAD